MEGPAVSYPSLTVDTSLRLQQLVNGWRGAERGEPLTALHNLCVNAFGLGGRHLVPANLFFVQALDVTNLQIALRNLNGRGQGAALRFRVRPDITFIYYQKYSIMLSQFMYFGIFSWYNFMVA